MYQEFDITSAIAPGPTRTRVALKGVSRVKSIYNSPSRSTEEFIMDAVADMGAADTHIMYVNSQLNALSDRLEVAGKIAKAVNTAKAQGREGFEHVAMLNPWEYAIEGKAGEFFSRIWKAICTACRRVIAMIANFIKWLGNVIASAGTKAQIRDYQTYVSRNRKAPKEADKIKFNTLDWKVGSDVILKTATTAAGHYAKLVGQNGRDVKALDGISKTDLMASIGKGDGFFAKIGRFFGTDGTFNGVKQGVERLKNEINEDLKDGINKVFKVKTGKTMSAKQLVASAFTKTGKVAPMECRTMRTLSKDFSILAEGSFAKQIKTSVAAAAVAQKEFAKYTKTMDALAKKFESIDKVQSGKNEVSSLSRLLSDLANVRVRSSSFYTGLMLEIQANALRFSKSAHVALKQYLKAGEPVKGKKAEGGKKSKESYQSLENLFNF